MMADQILTLLELNRATLARQMLLDRQAGSAPQAIERLAGQQAQQAMSPFVGLWTRLKDFRRADLAGPIQQREVVKATWVRATLHLVTAGDYLRFRAALSPMLAGAAGAIAGRREVEIDLPVLLDAAREYIAAQPRTFAEISAMLSACFPGQDVGALRYTVRTHLPLVQAPVEGGWSYPGRPAFTLAEAWLGKPIPREDRLPELLARCLAAFGPATVTDLQTWSGMANLKEVVQRLKPGLVTYRDERGRELFDLPGQPLPPADTPAPVRFLPEYDNLLLAHKDRARVLANEHRARVYLPGLRVAATFLVGGFVRGAWTVEKTRSAAALVLQPFAPLAAPDRAALDEEGQSLLRFIEPEAKSHAVVFRDGPPKKI
jgi:hypothetical protein